MTKIHFYDLFWLIFAFAYVESKHSSSWVFDSWKFVQNLFSNVLIWFIYTFNCFKQVLRCLAHEKWIWIDSIFSDTIQSSYRIILYDSNILWYDSNILWYYTSFIWNSLNQFKYSLILFDPDFTFYIIGSIVDFDDSIQTNFFNVIVGQTYSYLTHLYILLLTHFSTDWNNK